MILDGMIDVGWLTYVFLIYIVIYSIVHSSLMFFILSTCFKFQRCSSLTSWCEQCSCFSVVFHLRSSRQSSIYIWNFSRKNLTVGYQSINHTEIGVQLFILFAVEGGIEKIPAAPAAFFRRSTWALRPAKFSSFCRSQQRASKWPLY